MRAASWGKLRLPSRTTRTAAQARGVASAVAGSVAATTGLVGLATVAAGLGSEVAEVVLTKGAGVVGKSPNGDASTTGAKGAAGRASRGVGNGRYSSALKPLGASAWGTITSSESRAGALAWVASTKARTAGAASSHANTRTAIGSGETAAGKDIGKD